MRILLPTGAATESLVRRAAAGYDADVVVTGEIASFLTPHALRLLLKGKKYDCVIISGMCTASFEQVERETGLPVRPRREREQRDGNDVDDDGRQYDAQASQFQ